METPSSTRRVTRSQTLAQSGNTTNSNVPISRKIEDSEMGLSKSRKRTTTTKQQDRAALIDITNDSPIVGLAMGSLETPSSGLAKQRTFRGNNGTPGSGENLLRGQVKTLLQRVEEEAELSKLSLENRPFLHLVNSPLRLLAPTPANTPQILNLSGDDAVAISSSNNNRLASMNPSSVTHEQLIFQEVVSDIFDGTEQEVTECEKNLTRSLLLDFSEKLEFSNSSPSECSSVVTDQGGLYSFKEKSSSNPDDDDSSNWSIQVNASTHDDDGEDDEEEVIEEEEDDEDCDGNYEDYEEAEDAEEGLLDVDELCRGVSRISVNTTEKVMAKFTGKHTRFMYNTDDEIVEDHQDSPAAAAGGLSPSVLRLQGLPTPKGKHLRWTEEEGELSDD